MLDSGAFEQERLPTRILVAKVGRTATTRQKVIASAFAEVGSTGIGPLFATQAMPRASVANDVHIIAFRRSMRTSDASGSSKAEMERQGGATYDRRSAA